MTLLVSDCGDIHYEFFEVEFLYELVVVLVFRRMERRAWESDATHSAGDFFHDTWKGRHGVYSGCRCLGPRFSCSRPRKNGFQTAKEEAAAP